MGKFVPAKTALQAAVILLACWRPALGAEAKAPDVQGIDVLDYGIYTADKTASKTNDLGLTHDIVNNIQLVAYTKTISAQIGIKFGFRYTIEGAPEYAKVTVKQVTIYPPAGVMSPTKGLLNTNTFLSTQEIGTTGIFAGYGVNDPWELVPGTWTIQLWIGDRKFAEQSFTLVIQEATH